MITIWIVDRVNGTLSLCDVPHDTLKNYQRVRALSDNEWFDAYEWIG